MQEPHRLDRGAHDDLQDDRARDYHPSFVAAPGPRRYAKPLRHLRAASFAEQLEAQNHETLRQRQSLASHLGRSLLTEHAGPRVKPWPKGQSEAASPTSCRLVGL